MPEHPLARTVRLLQLDAFPGLDFDLATETILGTRVKLAADRDSVETPDGQTALIATAIVLAQMGLRITLEIPETPTIGQQPPVEVGLLRKGLVSRIDQLIQPHAEDETHDVVIALGSVAAEPDSFRLSASDSTVTIERGAATGAWTEADPSICALAGVLAGAAALPAIVRRLEQAHGTTAPPQMRVERDRIAIQIPRLELPANVAIGAVDIVSAGAITNAALFSLLRLNVHGRVRIFDDDLYESTNLNRYPLLSVADLGQSKATDLERFSRPGLEIIGIRERLLPGSGAQLAPTVLVGADNVTARYTAQQQAPGWLQVAGTSHFEVISSTHTPGAPCAGCVHPRTSEDIDPGDIPTISFVSLLTGK